MYKVGDYVFIRTDLEEKEYINSEGESLYCVSHMLKYKGKIAKIKKVTKACRHPFVTDLMLPITYNLTTDSVWSWSDEMLLPVTNSITVLLEERKIEY